MPNLLQATAAFGLFKVMTGLLDRTGMSTLIQTPCPFTLLVPLDDAFFQEADGCLEAWVDRFDHERLIALLARHLLPGRLTADDMRLVGSVRTHHGEPLAVTSGDRLLVAGAHVLQADIRCDNGVLHVIDRVLMPPTR